MHQEIFDDYYPAVLSDWWMDDWISRVYGEKRTKQLTDVPVTHHTTSYGRRYHVNGTHRDLVGGLVAAGRARIVRWMEAQGVSRDVITEFVQDRSDHAQSQPKPRVTRRASR